MGHISIVPIDGGMFGVQVTEGRTVTSHRVTVPDGFAGEVGVDADPMYLVQQTFTFLLERLENTSIRGEFSIEDLDRQFDDYRQELRSRCQRSRSHSES